MMQMLTGRLTNFSVQVRVLRAAGTTLWSMPQWCRSPHPQHAQCMALHVPPPPPLLSPSICTTCVALLMVWKHVTPPAEGVAHG